MRDRKTSKKNRKFYAFNQKYVIHHIKWIERFSFKIVRPVRQKKNSDSSEFDQVEKIKSKLSQLK